MFTLLSLSLSLSPPPLTCSLIHPHRQSCKTFATSTVPWFSQPTCAQASVTSVLFPLALLSSL